MPSMPPMRIATALRFRSPSSAACTLCIAALLVLAPWALGAQRVSGTVTDHGALVPGAVVLLLNGGGDVVARAVTRERGDYALSAPGEGRYSLRVLRIGYRPTNAGPYDVHVGAPTTADVALTGRVVTLPEVLVSDHTDCRVRPDSSALAFSLWDQARTALLAASLTASQRFGVRITRNDRMLDRSGEKVVSDSTTTQVGMSTNPIVSLPPDSLAKVGYVTADKTGGATYWGPDAAVLLSDSFATSHCIRTERAAADTGALSGVVGVAFEPTSAHGDRVDIRGVLWLDQKTAALRSLDYSYFNVPTVIERAGAGGHVEFLRLPDGSWTVSRWTIRYPAVAITTHREVSGIPGEPPSERVSRAVIGVRISRGDLLELRRDGDVWWERGRVSTTIRVVDSTTGQGIRGALVSLDSGMSATATAVDGTVRFNRVLPGPLRVQVHVPALDSLGVPAVTVPVTIADNPFEPVVVPVESAATLFASRCGASSLDWDEAAVRGVLPTPTAPPRTRIVEVTWDMPYARLGGGEPVVVRGVKQATTDAQGKFFVCGVPRDVPVSVRVLGAADPNMVRVVKIPSNALVSIADFSR